MLRYTMIFLLVAMAAAALGVGGVAGAVIEFAGILFVVFLILFTSAVVIGSIRAPAAWPAQLTRSRGKYFPHIRASQSEERAGARSE